MKANNSYSRIIKLSGFFSVIQFLNIAIALIRNKLVAVLLGPNGVGLMSLFTSTSNMLCNFTQMGLHISGVREVSQYKDDAAEQQRRINVIRVWSIILGCMGMLLCVVFSPLLNWFTFTWGNHTFHFIALSPMILFTTMANGEVAIMKGTYRMRRLAYRSVCSIVAALVVSVPLYYFFGETGIVPSLVAIALCQYFLNLSGRVKVEDIKDAISLGKPMIRLGMAFVVAGLFGSGCDFLIRTYLNNVGDLTAVGLYNTGYMISVTYGGMLFASMDNEYYPRLSAIPELGLEFNFVVNRQIRTFLFITAPFVALLIILMPCIIPLLFSCKFVEIVPMAQWAVLGLMARAAYLPIEYISLAKGDARSFMIIDSVSYVLMFVCVVAGYNLGGLTGTGMGIALSAFLGFVFDIFYCYWRFRFMPAFANIILLVLFVTIIIVVAFNNTLLCDC